MATSQRTHGGITNEVVTFNNGLTLVWLHDTAEEDSSVKEVLSSLYDNVFTFKDPDACLELVESIKVQTPCLSILISGKFGQLLVRDRLQPLNQVKDIYVFCFDTIKHGRWAQTCNKVRCVFADLNKILQCMQYDVQNNTTAESASVDDQQPPQPDERKEEEQQGERFTDDHNLFDQLTLNLLLQSPDDGIEDFNNFCRAHTINANLDVIEQDHTDVVDKEYFQPDQKIAEWYQPDLCFTAINSNDLTQLWTLRWFIRLFHRQLSTEHNVFIQEKTKFIVHYATWLSKAELDGMKHRIGQIIIITQLLLTHINRQTALDSIRNNQNNKHKIVFEIKIDPTSSDTIPYAEIKPEQVLLWFGARFRVTKLEHVEEIDDEENIYWLIGLSLCPTMDFKPSLRTLYEFYFKELSELNNLHHAFGRILIYKGYYSQADKWLHIGNYYLELAELALRQSHYEQAQIYLEYLSAECEHANLLRVYLYILTSNDNLPKARSLLLRLFSESTNKLLRARANIVFGFIHLILTQQIDQALEHFTLGHQVLCKLLPEIHPIVAKSFLALGYAYFTQRQLNDAKKSFEKAFNIQKQSLTYNHPDIAKTRNGLAHYLSHDKQRIKSALNELEYALDILVETFRHEQHHPEILATRNDIERIRKGKELRSRNTLLDYI